MKKEGESPVTYLNRGQTYLIELDAVNMDYPATMTSTFAITFHEESHRKVAKNYWKFWISQQEVPSEARAIELGNFNSNWFFYLFYHLVFLTYLFIYKSYFRPKSN